MKKQLFLVLLVTLSILEISVATSAHPTQINTEKQQPQPADYQQDLATAPIMPLDPGSGGGGRGETSAKY